MRIILLVFLVIASLYAQIELQFDKTEMTLNAIVNNLPSRFCPMRGFDGRPYCPKPKQVSTTSVFISELDGFNLAIANDSSEQFFSDFLSPPEVDDDIMPQREPTIYGGFGYDRVKRELKFPVLPSNAPARVNKAGDSAKRFKKVEDYLNYIYNYLSEKKQFEAGFYTMDTAFTERIAKLFGDYRIDVTATQKHHITHTTTATSMTPITDFSSAIDALPPYDPKNPTAKSWYRMIIDYWGTDVATTAEHGGVVYQQNLVKACYGGNITADQLKDIDAAMKKVPPGGMAYLRYRKLGIFNARGGNPELGMDKVQERIKSFVQAPAPIKFDVVPIWQVVKNAQKKEFLRLAVQDYINENKPNLQRLITQVAQQKIQTYKNAQTVHGFSYNVEQGGNLIVYWTGCPLARLKKSVYCPHCTLRGPFHGVQSGKKVQLYSSLGHVYHIERDANTGYARLVAMLNGKAVHNSAWVKTGCVSAPQFGKIRVGPYIVDVQKRLHRTICIDCLPVLEPKQAQHGHKHSFLNCVCPTF